MAYKLLTLDGFVSLEQALDDDDNVLPRLQYPWQMDDLDVALKMREDEIRDLVRWHLGVPWAYVSGMDSWRRGSFNRAIPVYVPLDGDQDGRRIWIRFPLPYKIGEASHPGTAREKLETEVATYIWLQDNCPDVPIPTLYGFGLGDGARYSHPQVTPLLQRLWWNMRRAFAWLLGRPVPSRYVQRSRLPSPFGSGYMLISNAEGRPLARSWEAHRHSELFRRNLFAGLARIHVSLSQIPLPRIGSLRLDGSTGVVSLSNRPLDMRFHLLENEDVPSGIPRSTTYASTEAFLSDLLALQDNKLVHQPNAVHTEREGRMQMAALAGMRAVMHRFVRRESRQGPFWYTLTDLQQNNIFVDANWNVSAVIDLEWAHALPVEMRLPPYWLSSRPVDRLRGDETLAELDGLMGEYFDAVEAEEARRRGGRDALLHGPVMRQGWASGAFWYFSAAAVPKGMWNIFNDHVQPRFNAEHTKGSSVFDDVFYSYWGVGAKEVVDRKLEDHGAYVKDLGVAFDTPPPQPWGSIKVEGEDQKGEGHDQNAESDEGHNAENDEAKDTDNDEDQVVAEHDNATES